MVIHSDRHRFGLAPGDPVLDGIDAGVRPATADDEDTGTLTGRCRRRVLDGVGHNVPGEAPDEVVRALLALLRPGSDRRGS